MTANQVDSEIFGGESSRQIDRQSLALKQTLWPRSLLVADILFMYLYKKDFCLKIGLIFTVFEIFDTEPKIFKPIYAFINVKNSFLLLLFRA